MRRVLPILFNTEMVTAILDERKTATRRLIKFPKNNFTGEVPRADNIKIYKNTLFAKKISFLEEPHYSFDISPPCHSEDILYVRETWAWEPCWDCGMDADEHNCCDGAAYRIYNHKNMEYGCYIYKASVEDNVHPSTGKWRPSIHMPKEAARIWLKVTDVRAERLQDITHIDIIMEGVEPVYLNARSGEKTRDDFARLWDSMIDKTKLDLYGWKANPWVWAIEFERCEKPEPCILKGIEPAEDKSPCIGYGDEWADEPCEMCKECRQCTGSDED